MTTHEFGSNGEPDADRIATYLDVKAQRFNDLARRTGDLELRVRANTLNVAASDIRAGLFEDYPVSWVGAAASHSASFWAARAVRMTASASTGEIRLRMYARLAAGYVTKA